MGNREKMGGFTFEENTKQKDKSNEVRIKFLKGEEKLTPAQEAELKARIETGDGRIAFLESKKIEGKLTPAEEAELKARREKI